MNKTAGKQRTVILIALVATSVLVIPGLAAPPEVVRYQTRLTDDAGIPLTGSYDFLFAIFDSASGGTSLWTEGPRTLVVQNGVLDILLGEVTPLPSTVFTSPDRWIEVTVDAAVLTPRGRLSSTPYAMAADRLGTLNLAEVQSDVDARIATHSSLPSAHHVKTTDAAELTSGNLDPDRLADGSVTSSKLDDGPGSNVDADTLDGVEMEDICIGLACSRSPLQIATLGWYEANETGLTFSTGGSGALPSSIVFDGENIWVANSANVNTVVKLRASDGALLDTFPVTAPEGLAFDGANIWVGNGGSNGTVTKLRASDGAPQGTFPAGTFIHSLAFDGSNIWVTNGNDATVTKVRLPTAPHRAPSLSATCPGRSCSTGRTSGC